MASQLFGVTGNPGLKPNQSADLNARLGGLSGLISLQQQQKQFEADEEFRKKQLQQEKDLAEDQEDFEKDQTQKEFGLEMGKLGFNLSTSGGNMKGGGPTLGDLGGVTKPTTPSTTGGPGFTNAGGGSESVTPTNTGGGFFNNIKPASLLSGGLTGFGMGTMFKDKDPEQRALLGAGAGLLTGFLSGGGWSGSLSSGLGGLLGGMAA